MKDINHHLADLLTEARRRSDAAEVYGLQRSGKVLFVANDGHPDYQRYEMAEVSVRLIHEGRVGSSCGSLNQTPSTIIDNAILSASYGSSADFDFTSADVKDHPDPPIIYDEACSTMTADDIADEALRIREYVLKRDPDIQFNTQIEVENRRVEYSNTHGRCCWYNRTRMSTFVQHMFEGSKEGIEKFELSCHPFQFSTDKLDEIVWERNAMKNSTSSIRGATQVLFLPTAAWALVMRLTFGVDGANIARSVSPLTDKVGEELFPSCVTILDAPNRSGEPGSIPFDDEGTPTTPRAIVEGGVLRDFIFHRRSAARAGTKSTGNGLKRIMWGDGIEHSPAPYFTNLVMLPGERPIRDIIASMDDGIVVCDVIGFHSGNILAGHYSMGVGTGFRVINGKPVGRIHDTMVSGNIYDDWKRMIALSKETEHTLVGRVPAMLIDDLQVSSNS